uniref:tRNA wybutosine-synthesizing protein 5 n=1 Tax=Esox lucius TaxID=8010 RepID=A0A6Q2Z161_ESOLU
MEKQVKMKVPVLTGVDKEVFRRDIYPMRRPVVLRDVGLGPCLDKWTLEYLTQKGGNCEVKVHVSTVPQMDFLHKNFVYRTLPFDKFIQRAAEKKHSDFFLCQDESYYLRSLGEDVRKEPADLRKQFPELAEDFHIPEFFESDQLFSSVFRISSCGLQLWTHYDVMDNLLAQVTGKKRVVLYSPEDALHLYLSGDKSEVLDIDSPDLERFPEFVKACRYECVLEPGDLLFIPALWFHNTLALQFGVGVNIFWRHLPAERLRGRWRRAQCKVGHFNVGSHWWTDKMGRGVMLPCHSQGVDAVVRLAFILSSRLERWLLFDSSSSILSSADRNCHQGKTKKNQKTIIK